MTSPEEAKAKFYDDLNTLIKSVPRCDKLILLGNSDARVGIDYKTWSNVIGKSGMGGRGKCKSNELLILQSCAEHGLLIINIFFHLQTHNKISWMHLKSKHWHLINYVITRRRDLQDVRVTNALCGAECWTDHRLIITKLNVCIHPPANSRIRGLLRGSIFPSCNLLLSDNCYMKTSSRNSQSMRCLRQMLSQIGLHQGTFFTPLLYTISATTCTNMRIGSIKTTLKSKSSWMINSGLIETIKMIPHPSLRKMCTVPSAARISFT